MKKVLLLCASHNDLGLVKALRKLGFYIIATGNREKLPGNKWVDKYINADYSDKDLILEIAKNEKIDNICACCNDYGVYTAAYVAEKLHIDGYDSYDTTVLLHNKDRFKEFAKENNILTPMALSYSDSEYAKKEVSKMNYPVIVKPVDCSAGNGISTINSFGDVNNAIDLAFKKSRLSKIVVEPFIKGTQHGLCTFLLNQKVVAVCSNNEYSIINPFRVEIDTFPATEFDANKDVLINQIEMIASKLLLKDGIFHLQYIIMDGVPYIIEVMRRTIGNMYHVLGNELNSIYWEYWEAKARCGISCEDFPRKIKQEGYYAYKTILAEKNGVIKDIVIPNEYSKYVINIYYLLSEGDIVCDYKNQPVGFIFFMFSSEQEMLSVLIDNYKCDLVKI